MTLAVALVLTVVELGTAVIALEMKMHATLNRLKSWELLRTQIFASVLSCTQHKAHLT